MKGTPSGNGGLSHGTKKTGQQPGWGRNIAAGILLVGVFIHYCLLQQQTIAAWLYSAILTLFPIPLLLLLIPWTWLGRRVNRLGRIIQLGLYGLVIFLLLGHLYYVAELLIAQFPTEEAWRSNWMLVGRYLLALVLQYLLVPTLLTWPDPNTLRSSGR